MLVIFVGCFALACSGWSQTQAEMNQDAAQRFAKADAELNVVYKKLMASLDDVAKEKLRAAQRAWVAFRDAEATFEADESRGGTLEPLLVFTTQADLTEERIGVLREIDNPNTAGKP